MIFITKKNILKSFRNFAKKLLIKLNELIPSFSISENFESQLPARLSLLNTAYESIFQCIVC